MAAGCLWFGLLQTRFHVRILAWTSVFVPFVPQDWNSWVVEKIYFTSRKQLTKIIALLEEYKIKSE
jgi:hypothetical protein